MSTEITFELLELCVAAVNDLSNDRRADIQQSSADTLDREEAFGYLVADCLGRELIDTEARAVGKRANYRMSACKTEVEKAEASAKKRTSRVRGKVTNEVVLEARLATIEEEKASAIAAVYDATYDLKLPNPKRSKVVVKEVTPPVVDPLAELTEAARVAEEDLTEAEDELPVLRRMVEKSFESTKKQLAALIKPVPPKNWLDKVAVEAYQNRVDEWKGEYEGAIDLMKTGQQMYSDLKGEIGQLTVAALAAQLDLTIATRAAQLASVQHDAKAAQAEARALEEERLEDARRREARV